jgi:hypothetical protein
VQFVLPQTLEGDKKAEATQKLQSKLNQGLEQYNLTVSQDTDVPYSNVIGFLIPIADIKLLIKNAIGGGAAPEEAPAEEPAPEEPMKEMKRMKELAGLKEAFDYQEDKIVMDDDTKDAILDNSELQDFITPKHFVRNKMGQIVLGVDWMDYDQFDKLAKFLGIKY